MTGSILILLVDACIVSIGGTVETAWYWTFDLIGCPGSEPSDSSPGELSISGGLMVNRACLPL